MIERYEDKEVKKIFEDAHKFKTWFEIEIAYLKAYLEQNNKNDDALINRLHAKLDKIDWQKFSKRVEHYDKKVHHDVIAFLHALEDELSKDARLLHIGLTSSDIVDTSLALMLKQAGAILEQRLTELIAILLKRAKEYKGVVMLGRTHGQAAEPLTFGIKLLSFVSEFMRAKKRLQRAIKEISVGKFSGAVGVYAHSNPKIEKDALSFLGLDYETIATQVVCRDRHAHFFTTLAIIAGSIERLSVEIRLLMHGQVKEAFESFVQGQKGSSAMPHKKNPILSENLTGLSRLIRSYALSSLENQALWHERDISHSSVERVISQDACQLLGFSLTRLHKVIANLHIDKEQMTKNINQARDKIYSQSILLALVKKGMMRQDAYKLVQHAALSTKESFKESLINADIKKYLSEKDLQELMTLKHVLRYEDELYERVCHYNKQEQ